MNLDELIAALDAACDDLQTAVDPVAREPDSTLDFRDRAQGT